jgi:hypothetical protein
VRTAVVYRVNARDLKSVFEQNNYNPGDAPQFELCEFTDGRVAMRWLTGSGSCVWWDALQDLFDVHIYAHPDYGTRIEWSDGQVQKL